MTVLRRRQGSVLFVMAMSLTVLMGAAAWVVDLSSGMLAQTRFQVAADAAALAASRNLVPVPNLAAATASAVQWGAKNGVTIQPSQVSFFDRPGGGKAVSVRVQQPVGTTFGRIFGIVSMPVSAASAATLGGLPTLPRGLLPFGLPAYQDSAGRWYGLTNVDGSAYSLLTGSPATQIVLKTGGGNGNSGNYLALALDGKGGSTYRNTIINGSQANLNYGDQVQTEPGNMSGPTKQGFDDRLSKGPQWADVYVPLIPRSEWEGNHGRSTVTIIGFVSARITVVTNKAEVYAQYVDKIVPLPGRAGETRSVGIRTPILVLPPGI